MLRHVHSARQPRERHVFLRPPRRAHPVNDIVSQLLDVFGGLAAIVLAILYFRLRWVVLPAREREARKRAVARSTAVTRGQAFEHLAPFMDDFGYNPRDARFLGSPIDLVVFDGLSESDVREIVFLEIKTGQSQLSARERAVQKAVDEQRVTWRELRGL